MRARLGSGFRFPSSRSAPSRPPAPPLAQGEPGPRRPRAGTPAKGPALLPLTPEKARSDQGLRSPGASRDPARIPRARPPRVLGATMRQSLPAWHSGAPRGKGTPAPMPPLRAEPLLCGPSPLGWRRNPRLMGTGSPHPAALNPVSCGFRPERARALAERGVRDGKTLRNRPSGGRGQTIASAQIRSPRTPEAPVPTGHGAGHGAGGGGLAEAGEARAVAGAAVGECCSVGEGRGQGRAGGGSSGEREGGREREREREKTPGCCTGCSRQREGMMGGERSAWDAELSAATSCPSSHRSPLGAGAPPHPGFVHSRGGWRKQPPIP